MILPRGIECPTLGRVHEQILTAARYARNTYQLQWRISMFSHAMTQKAGTEVLRMPRSTLSGLPHRGITARRDGHRTGGRIRLEADEISYCKGRKFTTLLYHLEHATAMWVGARQGCATVDPCFSEASSKYQRYKIHWAGCDISPAYTDAIKHHCPNATLVIDRFHLTKPLNDGIDAVHKEKWRILPGEQHKAIKGLRCHLYRPPGTHTKGRTPALTRLRHSNRRVHRA